MVNQQLDDHSSALPRTQKMKNFKSKILRTRKRPRMNLESSTRQMMSRRNYAISADIAAMDPLFAQTLRDMRAIGRLYGSRASSQFAAKNVTRPTAHVEQ
jgi:hypothetical protein